MKATSNFKILQFVFILCMFPGFYSTNLAQNDGSGNFKSFKGIVIDAATNEPLVFATLAVEGTNIATVTNSEGEFILKVPESSAENDLSVSFIGYDRKKLPLTSLKADANKLALKPISVNLVEVSVFPTDPNLLIKAIMGRRNENYMDQSMRNIAFYRETIKKGWNYVSLTEAVVDIYKQSYSSGRADQVSLLIGRKSTDYDKVDTLVFKLQGGPLAALMLDIMKEPYTLFYEENIEEYQFQINKVTRLDDRLLYVISFQQKPVEGEPWFYGDLYVDTENLAITSASFNLNLDNKEAAARMFIRKKPKGAKVYPTKATYMVNYREKDGHWYFAYSRGQVDFKINWRKKLFNSNYYTTMELAVTDRINTENGSFKASDKLKMNVIMEDAVQGFANEDFWGDYNVIEPEQPIENAIKRIQKQLKEN
ncbi:carboxypeptidase-like regulatory domain-containing protein [Geofilum sp. OHC36d9]|uniref:carboxypeptidase-like regulatory domain-containing protein n=1 Tax=Geofilum sp. OHC36d9 TaxID=3458413 RepID=UPI0040334833